MEKNSVKSTSYFLYETFSRITRNQPNHQFIFLFDKPFTDELIFNTNVTAHTVSPLASTPLKWKYWYDVKIPGLLKKYKADVFVGGNGFCSLYTKIPQCLLAPDLTYIQFPKSIQKLQALYLKKYIAKQIQKASTIAVYSEFSKQEIKNNFNQDASKINVIYKGINEIFRPVTNEEKENTKSKYTDGKEFFMVAGTIHSRKNLINLLKAFSIFKKRQQTGMKLVLSGRLSWNYGSFLEKLESYKYRNDVIVTGLLQDSDLALLTGSAYALIQVSNYENFGSSVLQAMQCDVPVITVADSAMEEITQGAALYANAASSEDIAEKMKLLYKDENLKKELIRKGQKVAPAYSWDRTAALCWQAIENAVS